MLVKKPTRVRGLPKKKGVETIDHNPNPNLTRVNKNTKAGGLRFQILDEEAEIQTHIVVENNEANKEDPKFQDQEMEIAKDIPEENKEDQDMIFDTVQLADNSQNVSAKFKENIVHAIVNFPKQAEPVKAKIKGSQNKVLTEKNANIPLAKSHENPNAKKKNLIPS